MLSSAEKLDHGRIWQRPSAQVTAQIKFMCDAVLRGAERVGGQVGEAVAINAAVVSADELVRDHRFRASITDRVNRPAPHPDGLSAFKLVEDAARDSGSEGRYITLVMLRAATLDEAGRSDEALQTLDKLLAYLKRQGGARPRAGAAPVKVLRRRIEASAGKSN